MIRGSPHAQISPKEYTRRPKETLEHIPLLNWPYLKMHTKQAVRPIARQVYEHQGYIIPALATLAIIAQGKAAYNEYKRKLQAEQDAKNERDLLRLQVQQLLEYAKKSQPKIEQASEQEQQQPTVEEVGIEITGHPPDPQETTRTIRATTKFLKPDENIYRFGSLFKKKLSQTEQKAYDSVAEIIETELRSKGYEQGMMDVLKLSRGNPHAEHIVKILTDPIEQRESIKAGIWLPKKMWKYYNKPIRKQLNKFGFGRKTPKQLEEFRKFLDTHTNI